MATAKKLPSGSWHCRVYSHTETITLPNGTTKEKKIYKSFTYGDDPGPKGKRICERMASEWAAKKELYTSPGSMTFGDALKAYIANRESVLSPTTIRVYKMYSERYFVPLADKNINEISQDDIQILINQHSTDHSPKTVRNMYGLISAVFSTYRPDFRLKTDLPKKVRPQLYIPTEIDIKALLRTAKGTEMEIPILLAVFGPMRRGEICALDSDHISGNRVHVEYSMALNADRQWVKKSPKTYSSNRYIDFPDFVGEKLRAIKGPVTNLNPDMITKRFYHVLEHAGVPHFRFHDLRHYSVSFLHALGIPNVDIMGRGGWSTDHTLKNVYLHSLDDKAAQATKQINDKFSSLYDHV